MQSLMTKISRELRKLAVMADYLAWLLLDPSKFTFIDKASIKKVLVVHLGAMGEILVATPLLPALKTGLKAQIKFMVAPGKEEVLQNNPYVDEVISYKNSFKENLEYLRKEKFDLAVILWPCTPKMTYMCLLAGIKCRIGGFKNIKDGLNFFLTRRMLDLRKNHAVQSNLDVIRTIGIDNPNPKIDFYISKKDVATANQKLGKIKSKSYIVIHPGFSFAAKTKYPSRWWPAERYAEVADYLIGKYKVKVLLTGSNEEKVFSEQIKEKSKNKKDVLITNSIFSIGEFAYVLSKAKLVIAPGTGTIHLTTAFDTPIIELIGKESLEEWHPWTSENNYKIVHHPEVCTECDKNYCRKKTQECILSITPQEVINAAESLLKKK